MQVGRLRTCIRSFQRVAVPVLFVDDGLEDAVALPVTVQPRHSLGWLARFAWQHCHDRRPPEKLEIRGLLRSESGGHTTLRDSKRSLVEALDANDGESSIIFICGTPDAVDMSLMSFEP